MEVSSEHEANKAPVGLHRIPLISACSSIFSASKLSTSSSTLHIVVFPSDYPQKKHAKFKKCTG